MKKTIKSRVKDLQDKVRLDDILDPIKCPNCKAKLTRENIRRQIEGTRLSYMRVDKTGHIEHIDEDFEAYDGSDYSGLYCTDCGEKIPMEFLTEWEPWGKRATNEEILAYERLKFVLRRKA